MEKIDIQESVLGVKEKIQKSLAQAIAFCRENQRKTLIALLMSFSAPSFAEGENNFANFEANRNGSNWSETGPIGQAADEAIDRTNAQNAAAHPDSNTAMTDEQRKMAEQSAPKKEVPATTDPNTHQPKVRSSEEIRAAAPQPKAHTRTPSSIPRLTALDIIYNNPLGSLVDGVFHVFEKYAPYVEALSLSGSTDAVKANTAIYLNSLIAQGGKYNYESVLQLSYAIINNPDSFPEIPADQLINIQSFPAFDE